ncbi:MAG: hypothetical protein MRJ68_11715 [Nitrospira sp.]|nr:hypothetical protein [Nitrospira sp.]
MIRLTILTVLIAFAFIGYPAWAEPARANTTYIVWVDITRSITQADLRRWHTTVERKFLSTIACGDRVVMFPVQKDTTRAGAWVEWVTAPLDDEPTKSELLACRKAQAELKRSVRTIFHDLVTAQPSAGWTDLVGTLERLAGYTTQTGQQRMVVLYLSDMVQASPELNLEKTKLTADTIGPLTDAIILNHQSALSAWNGVRVRCWLNVVGPDVAPPLNSQPILKAFYTELFRKTGSVLEEFQSL